MKYVKTIDLWQGSNEQMLRSGQLRLQSGQWVRCGNDGAKSRFVRAHKHHITVIHGSTTAEANAKYKLYIQIHKERKACQ